MKRLLYVLSAVLLMMFFLAPQADAKIFNVMIGGVPHVAETGPDGHVFKVTWQERGKDITILASKKMSGENVVTTLKTEWRPASAAPKSFPIRSEKRVFAEKADPSAKFAKAEPELKGHESLKASKPELQKNLQGTYQSSAAGNVQENSGRENLPQVREGANYFSKSAKDSGRENVEGNDISAVSNRDGKKDDCRENNILNEEKDLGDREIKVSWMRIDRWGKGVPDNLTGIETATHVERRIPETGHTHWEEKPVWAKIFQIGNNKPHVLILCAAKPE